MNHRRKPAFRAAILFPLLSWLLAASVAADVPHLIRYQGTAVDSQGVPLEGPYTLTFRLYEAASGGTAVWAETQPDVPVIKGHFSVLLGSITPLTSMDWSHPCWLAILVNGDELSPRQPITSVPLAITAERVNTSGLTDDDHSLVPAGAVILWTDIACPAGYTRLSALDGKFVVADATFNAAAGGSNTKDISHTHGAGSYAGPSHTHTGTTGDDGNYHQPSNSPWAGGNQVMHTHPFTTDAGGTGAVTGTSGVGGPSAFDIRPIFATVLLCKKD